MSNSLSETRAIAFRYLAALFALTSDTASQDDAAKNLDVIAQLIKENPELLRTFNSPVLSRKVKSDVAVALLNKTKPSDILVNFIKVLAKNDRLNCLPIIADLYKKELLKKRAITSVTITSAQTISDKQSAEIIQAIEKATKSQVQAQFAKDTDLLGGVTIHIGAQLLDFSLRGKLLRLGGSLKASASNN